jgi:hypothetical protein
LHLTNNAIYTELSDQLDIRVRDRMHLNIGSFTIKRNVKIAIGKWVLKDSILPQDQVIFVWVNEFAFASTCYGCWIVNGGNHMIFIHFIFKCMYKRRVQPKT